MKDSVGSVLIISEWYPPAFKAGGPIRSVYNLVKLLRAESDLKVLTSSYDLDGSNISHDADYIIEANDARSIRKYVKAHAGPVYLNSMFSWNYGILPLFHSRKIYLSPRGMLKASALRHKPLKKRIYLRVANLLRLYAHTHFIASNQAELEEIKEHIKVHKGISILQNVSTEPREVTTPITKKPGEAKLVHVGRIHAIKNLIFLLDVLERIETPIHVSIIGPIEDERYWGKCLTRIKQLQAKGHEIQYHGALPPEEIESMVLTAHVLTSPSLGENFGHAIFNALAVGRPVLISDRNPWQYLQRENAGWDVDLSLNEWVRHINEFIEFDQAEFDKMCAGALNYAKLHSVKEELKERYLQQFLS